MNKDQRKFLLEHVQRQHNKAMDDLKKVKPRPPSLNNYLVADILSGHFKIKSQEQIKAAIRNRALSLGPNDALLTGDQRGWSRRSYNDDEESGSEISLEVSTVFEYPVAYLSALEAYEKALKTWEQKQHDLIGLFETLQLKIQLGSDRALSALVDQADNLADLKLINSRLQIQERTEK